MSVSPLQNNRALAEFMKLAQTARSRNPVLHRAPEAGAAQKQAFAQPAGTNTSAPQAMRSASMADNPQPIQYTRILGTRFDSYA
jgi:hypothetical protein